MFYPCWWRFPHFLSNLASKAPSCQPSSERPLAIGVLADIVETEHVPYLTEVTRENQGASVFHPNSSDILIQQAEEKFRSGSRFYLSGDFDHARSDFDAAIALMLRASDSPTNHSLFEHTLENMVDSINRYDLTGLGAAQTDEIPGFDKSPLDDILQMTFPVDPGIKDKVITQLKTTSSVLPLVVNDAVLGYVNYFSGRGRRTIENGLIRAGRYDAMITKIFADEGVPPELIRLAQAESGFMPRAVSVAAAKGMWQFVKFRGNQYGLMQTPWTDDRLDPEKATRAAAHHLHDLFNEFHDWYLAMAAYNCGPGVIEKAVERTGYADFWELRARKVIPQETANYVPIILAMTIVSKNAAGVWNLRPYPRTSHRIRHDEVDRDCQSGADQRSHRDPDPGTPATESRFATRYGAGRLRPPRPERYSRRRQDRPEFRPCGNTGYGAAA